MIRDATHPDLPAIARGMVRLQQLHIDAFPEIYKPFSEHDAITYLSKLITQTDFHLRVAIHAEQLAGHAVFAVESTPSSMFKHAQRFGHVTQIEVDPKFRGLGIGNLLLADIDELGATMGLNRIVLDVWSFNDTAREFFRGFGYTGFGSKLIRRLESNAG